MKKLVTLFAILALVAPVLADVSVTCEDANDGSGWFTISYDASGEAELVSGFGLDVTTDGANIVAIEYIAGSPYNIYPGTIVISGGAVADDGNAIAPADACEALAGLGTTGVTLEMAALYDRDDTGAAPAASGALVKLQLDASGQVSINLNGRRGGVVLEDAAAATVAASTCDVEAGPACWSYPCFPLGDSNGDGFLTFIPDVKIVLDNWGGYDECADYNKDGFLTFLGDVKPLLDNWTTGCP